MAQTAASSPPGLPDTGLEPGDRFEIPITIEARTTGQLLFPETVWSSSTPIPMIEDEHGQTLEVSRATAADSLIVPAARQALSDRSTALWLEYQEPGRFRLLVEGGAAPAQRGAGDRTRRAHHV
jgi:hypothetical protein